MSAGPARTARTSFSLPRSRSTVGYFGRVRKRPCDMPAGSINASTVVIITALSEDAIISITTTCYRTASRGLAPDLGVLQHRLGPRTWSRHHRADPAHARTLSPNTRLFMLSTHLLAGACRDCGFRGRRSPAFRRVVSPGPQRKQLESHRDQGSGDRRAGRSRNRPGTNPGVHPGAC